MKSILLVEDDINLTEVLSAFLERNNLRITAAPNIATAMKYLKEEVFSLLVLDVALTDGIGFEILQKSKNYLMKTPKIIISGMDSLDLDIEAYLNGASLFHQKPLNFKLLLAQIESLTSDQEDIHIDYKSNSLFYGNKSCILSQQEVRIIEKLVNFRGYPVPRSKILSDCIGRSETDSALETSISRIREKLKKNNFPLLITTKRNIGYSISVRKGV
jgi:DNA-binding response OmpR family regulator